MGDSFDNRVGHNLAFKTTGRGNGQYTKDLMERLLDKLMAVRGFQEHVNEDDININVVGKRDDHATVRVDMKGVDDNFKKERAFKDVLQVLMDEKRVNSV